MKRTTFLAMCAMLLLGLLLGRMFCFHLAAQSAVWSDEAKEDALIALLEPKIKECSEQELLEMKIKIYRKIVEGVEQAARAGIPSGRAELQAEAYAQLASAEIELYRVTGDRDKLLAAMDAKIEALTEKHRAAKMLCEIGQPASYNELLLTDIQLLDALLERKRIEK